MTKEQIEYVKIYYGRDEYGHEPEHTVVSLDQICDLALEALSLREELARSRELVKEVLKLKPRWDHHGAFYKPSDVDPILEKLRAAANADSERSEETHGGET